MSLKLHPPILKSILYSLQKIILENYYSDKVLEQLFKSNKKLGKRDRQIIAETTYNIVRYYYLYRYLSRSDRIEEIVKTYFQFCSNSKDLLDYCQKNKIPEYIQLSYNDELWNEGVHQLGEDKWIKEATALNQPAPLVIRTNTLKITRRDLKEQMSHLGIETIEHHDVAEALIIKNKNYLHQNELFQKGYYEFQDLSSQRVAHFIPKEILNTAKRIVDACAGAGGKTLHLSALKNNKGQIIAMDVEEKKLIELRKRVKRAGCQNVDIRHIHSTKVIKRLHQSADIVLIDAPCTGTGVIKRNPDTKLKFTKETMEKMVALQRTLLCEYSSMVKQNGYLLYVTCSVLPIENEQQVKWFIGLQKNFSLVKQSTIYPSEGFDGFFMALLKKD